MNKMYFWALFFVTCLFVTQSLVATSLEKEYGKKANPKSVTDSKTIGVYKIVINVPPQTKVGAHHDGWLRIKQYRYEWENGISMGSDNLIYEASKALHDKGYNVLGADNLLFNDESDKAEFQLGGTITDLSYNTYAPLAGGFSEGAVTVEWQLQNALSRKIVLKVTTSGYGKSTKKDKAVLIKAYKNALQHLLENKEFVNTLEIKEKNQEITLNSFDELSIINNNEEEFILPKDLDKIMNNVVVIRIGNTLGSGVVVSTDGYILTAAHVVDGVTKAHVTLKSGLEFDADVVRIDNKTDSALLKLNGKGFPYAKISADSIASIGTDLYAIGAPTSELLSYSVSKGIISSYRIIDNSEYIQTDTSLNPGNSGGPVFGSDGELLGIVSRKLVDISIEGLSFCVSVKTITNGLNIKWVK